MRPESLFLREMIDAAETIVELVGPRSMAELDDDETRRAAVLWHFTVLGEAASQLADSFKEANPSIPWAKATRLRNRIVHGYWDISIQIIHAAATDDLPPLIESLGGVLATFESPRPSDEQIERWAVDAEDGLDDDQLKLPGPQSAQSPRGRNKP